MKKVIDAFDYAGDICKAMKKGILLTTQADGQVNTMTIGWGTMGVEWGKPIFVAYVRGSRYTHLMIENSGEFTVNIPIGEFDSKILGVCGTIDRVRKGADGSIQIYPAMGLSLTYDHRAVDGTPASRFLQELCKNLENFTTLLAK